MLPWAWCSRIRVQSSYCNLGQRGSIGGPCSSLAAGSSWGLFFDYRFNLANGHRLLCLFVDVKLKDVWPRIMADNIQVVLSPDNLGAIDLGGQNRFALRVRPGKKIPEGVDNATAAAANDGVRFFSKDGTIVGREITATVELVARKHETSSLDSDVPHRSDPGVAVIGGRRAINLDPFGIHSRAHQRKIILPANHRAKPSERCFKYRHGGTVAKAPHQTLGTSWHDLAVLAKKTAIRREEQYRTVEGATIPLDDSDDQVDFVASGRTAKLVNRGTGNIHAALPVSAKVLATFFRSPTNHRAKIQPSRIRGNKRFGKKHQLRTLAGSFLAQRTDFVQRALSVESDRSSLDDSYVNYLTRR